MDFLFSRNFSRRQFWALAAVLLVGEAILGALIIKRVPYTEIDWIAYMQEVEGWVVEGSTDYRTLKGDTGPLVYPAGFLYVYRALRWLTGGGRGADGIRLAQWVFLGVYLATEAVVLAIYERARPGPPILVALLAVSKRVHSLYMLRLFNDCIEMLLAYGAVYVFTKRKWLAGCVLFSLALSIKMNALLLAPGLLFLLVRNTGIVRTAGYALVCVALQAAIGALFLATFPESYLAKAFELSRVFFYKWTVNLKFLPEEVFVSKALATGLLAGHLAALVAFGALKWCASDGGLLPVLARVGLLPSSFASGTGATGDIKQGEGMGEQPQVGKHHQQQLRGGSKAAGGKQEQPPAAAVTPAAAPPPSSGSSWLRGGFVDSPAFIAYVLFTSNFTGIAFSRTMHYQFYTWYFHTLVFLVGWSLASGAAPFARWAAAADGEGCVPTRRFSWLWLALGVPLAGAALAGIEFAFNVGDAEGAGTPLSSAALQAGHALILAALLLWRAPPASADAPRPKVQ